MIRRTLLALTALSMASAAWGEVTPLPGPGDPHIQRVFYDANQVVSLRIADGFALTLAFSPDERIEGVTLGNSGAWQVQANKRADRLIVKSRGAAATTNMTVMTDARTYNFTLRSEGAGARDLPYFVSFVFPPPASNDTAVQTRDIQSYKVRGARSLRPSMLSDDGEVTSIGFPKDAILPAIYAVDAQGHETLVNGQMRDGVYAIEGVYSELVFRSGKAKASAKRMAPKKDAGQ